MSIRKRLFAFACTAIVTGSSSIAGDRPTFTSDSFVGTAGTLARRPCRIAIETSLRQPDRRSLFIEHDLLKRRFAKIEWSPVERKAHGKSGVFDFAGFGKRYTIDIEFADDALQQPTSYYVTRYKKHPLMNHEEKTVLFTCVISGSSPAEEL